MTHAQQFGQGEGTLTRAAGLVTDARADFTTIAARLTGQVDGLRSGWHGRGGSAFFALHQAWNDKQATIVGALDGLARSLTATEHDNVATDDHQSASYGRLTSRLG